MAVELSGIQITTDAIKTKLPDMQPDGASSRGDTGGVFAANFQSRTKASFDRSKKGGAGKSNVKVNTNDRSDSNRGCVVIKATLYVSSVNREAILSRNVLV